MPPTDCPHSCARVCLVRIYAANVWALLFLYREMSLNWNAITEALTGTAHSLWGLVPLQSIVCSVYISKCIFACTSHCLLSAPCNLAIQKSWCMFYDWLCGVTFLIMNWMMFLCYTYTLHGAVMPMGAQVYVYTYNIRRIYNYFEVGNLCMYVNLWSIYALLCFLSVSGRSQYQWRDVPHLLIVLPSKQCHTLWKQSFWCITYRRSQVSVYVWNSKMPIYCTL